MLKSIVVDNFFENIDEVYNHVKKIETYDWKNYPKELEAPEGTIIEWPGYRSTQLAGKDDWLLEKFSQGFKEHFTGLIRGQVVQNRAVLFSSSYKHRAINNHGTDVNNGRLTLNIFMDK